MQFKKFYIPTIAVLTLLNLHLHAQNDSSSLFKKGKLSLEGYVDAYFSYSLAHPKDATHPYFVSFNRDNEVNVNFSYISLKYTSDRVRATFTPGYGTYMNANYASERQTLQNIVEANAGIRLFKNKEIWLDAGVMSSPFTNENAYSIDQLNYTRSLGADNVPYYLTGAKLTLPLDSRWTAYLYLLNGWQVIQAQHDPLDFGEQLEGPTANGISTGIPISATKARRSTPAIRLDISGISMRHSHPRTNGASPQTHIWAGRAGKRTKL